VRISNTRSSPYPARSRIAASVEDTQDPLHLRVQSTRNAKLSSAGLSQPSLHAHARFISPSLLSTCHVSALCTRCTRVCTAIDTYQRPNYHRIYRRAECVTGEAIPHDVERAAVSQTCPAIQRTDYSAVAMLPRYRSTYLMRPHSLPYQYCRTSHTSSISRPAASM